MKNLTPAEDSEMFVKSAQYVADLDFVDLIEFMREVYIHSPKIEKMAEISIAAETAIEGLKDIKEIA